MKNSFFLILFLIFSFLIIPGNALVEELSNGTLNKVSVRSENTVQTPATEELTQSCSRGGTGSGDATLNYIFYGDPTSLSWDFSTKKSITEVTELEYTKKMHVKWLENGYQEAWTTNALLLGSNTKDWLGNPIINEQSTSFTSSVDGIYYGSGTIGWHRSSGDNFVYTIFFNSVNNTLAQSLSGIKKIVITLGDATVFTSYIQQVSGTLTGGGYRNNPNYLYNFTNENIGFNIRGYAWDSSSGACIATYFENSMNPNGPSETLYNSYYADINSVYHVFRNTTTNFTWLNDTTNQITNRTLTIYHDTGSGYTGSNYILFKNTTNLNESWVGLSNLTYDIWLRTNIIADNSNYSYKLLTGQNSVYPGGGTSSGQISFDYSNPIAGNAFGINTSIASFSNYTTYYIDTLDPSGAEITGFPVPFNSQTYSTGRMWTFQKFGTYNTTLKYCSMFDITCSNFFKTGLHTLDSATLLVTAGSFNYSVVTDKPDYQPNSTIRITVTNPSSSDVFVTAYGTTGVITEVAWNTVAPGNQATPFTKVLPGYLPFGQYVINVATTDGYSPIVAQAKFNISAPSNTSNTLFVAWGDIVYKVGKTGIVKTTSNFNASTLTILSPGGRFTSYVFPANSTNTTGVNLNEEGLWKAKISDNGNASNFLIATTGASNGNPTDNETIASCKDAASYVCWDKKEYTQGQAYLLSFRFTSKITDIINPFPYIEITNPSASVVYNQSVNASFDVDQNVWIGTLGGSFSPQASLGIYFAKLKTRSQLGDVEIRAESAAIVNAGTGTGGSGGTGGTVPDNTTTLLSGNFVLIILVLFAFLGVGYEIGHFMGAALGFGSGFIVLGVIGVMPIWALFLFALLVIVAFTAMVAKTYVGSGDN